MMDSLPWMLDQTDHEQNEEQYSFYQHQNPLTKPTVHSIGMKSQLYSLWKVWYALSLFLKTQVVCIWFFIDTLKSRDGSNAPPTMYIQTWVFWWSKVTYKTYGCTMHDMQTYDLTF